MSNTYPPAVSALPAVDWPTVVAVSAFAYIIHILLHEHMGHSAACVALGGRPTELGAFYVECPRDSLSVLNSRLVALAGPVVSLLTGILGFAVLARLRRPTAATVYAVWLVGTLGWLNATGYLLFSGFGGIGDLGFEPGAAFAGATPEWLWRLVLVGAGAASYFVAARLSARTIDPYLGGGGVVRVRYGFRLALVSYLTGGLLSVLIGLLNPYGIVIVLISAAASSLGGTSALLWLMQLLDRRRPFSPWLRIERSWSWIAVSVVVAVAYAVVFGPTIRL